MKRFIFISLVVFLLAQLYTSCQEQKLTELEHLAKSSIKQDVKLYEASAKEDFKIYKENVSYLRYHQLKSLNYLEKQSPLSQAEFEALIATIPFEREPTNLKAQAALIFFYTTGKFSNLLIPRNTPALSIFALEEKGLRHYYFERTRNNTYVNIENLNQLTSSLSNETLRILNFAHTKNQPVAASSSIIHFQKKLDSRISEKLNKRGIERSDALYEALAADPTRNGGFMFKDNGGNPGESCGYPCQAPSSGWMHCTFVLGTSTYFCESDCAGSQINQIAIEQKWGIAIDLDKLRTFREQFLKKSAMGRKYIGYYAILSKNLRYDYASVKKYMAVMPGVYKAIDQLMAQEGKNDIVLSAKLHAKTLELIDMHMDTRNPDFRRVLFNIKEDLDKVKNKKSIEVKRMMNIN